MRRTVVEMPQVIIEDTGIVKNGILSNGIVLYLFEAFKVGFTCR